MLQAKNEPYRLFGSSKSCLEMFKALISTPTKGSGNRLEVQKPSTSASRPELRIRLAAKPCSSPGAVASPLPVAGAVGDLLALI